MDLAPRPFISLRPHTATPRVPCERCALPKSSSGDVSSCRVSDERDRRVNLLIRYRYAPGLMPALVALLLFYLALLLGAAAAVAIRALLYPH